MYWKILDTERIALLKEIVSNVDIGEFYMAGGTALSLQLGLRKSFDFDFFVPHSFNTDTLYKQLENICPDEIKARNVDGRGTCDVVMKGVQVSFFEYPYNTLYAYKYVPDIPELALANICDIATMKAVAIGGRGAKKDFFDFYEILNKTDYTIHDLISDLYKKYGKNRDFSYIGMGLNYFEEAEQEVLPEVFVEYDWREIKKAFSDIQKDFFYETTLYEKKRNRNSSLER